MILSFLFFSHFKIYKLLRRETPTSALILHVQPLELKTKHFYCLNIPACGNLLWLSSRTTTKAIRHSLELSPRGGFRNPTFTSTISEVKCYLHRRCLGHYSHGWKMRESFAQCWTEKATHTGSKTGKYTIPKRKRRASHSWHDFACDSKAQVKTTTKNQKARELNFINFQNALPQNSLPAD